MIRLLLVDDQSIVRKGLRMRLLLEPDITVIGEASNGAQAHAAGAAAFVEKSGTLEVLLATIRQIVEFTGRT